MYSMIRPLLFSMDAERVHALSLSLLDYVPQWCLNRIKPAPIQALGLQFPHVVGLAAGLDKNGQYLNALAKLGFSFIELGTVTPKPQEGNPKPRLFRLPEAHALINRMGFNNQGVDVLVAYVKKAHYQGILGINIGKNKDTPLEHAAADYIYCLNKVYEFASYVTINVSSPNTPDLRQLQQKEYFSNLLAHLVEERKRLSDMYQRYVPLVVKISPDEDGEMLKQMADVILNYRIDGIIASNTTCSRNTINHIPHAKETGGLSGQPLWELSTECLRLLKTYVGNAVPLIGVGGIESCEQAQAKLDAGASLIQVYTGLIYQGPKLVYDLATGVNQRE